eukprot:CAMPEP_0206425894 /NCGR_PEP_ID=MMETSP0324_2-20121206/4059_1 /ASSEMBLY_ACC=CAM_ASM_000836 /TAXON_ID=2866 /ORGANISM="Crypthecodinium cohnii, Strain Seligo" /LENGTH=277 /DNA_ID=CAMNT_0053890755 /DNA_START=168 /DNA_END=1001 /DNA_ORIENTATION=+
MATSSEEPHASTLAPRPASSQSVTFPGPHGGSEGTDSAVQMQARRLSQRLSVVQSEVEHEHNARFDALLGRMRQLDDRVAASQDHNTRKFTVLKETLLKFDRELAMEQQNLGEVSTKAEGEIDKVDTGLQASLLAEQDARRQEEERILSNFEEKTNRLKEDINHSMKQRSENEAHLRRYLEEDIPKLYENLKKEVADREAMEQRMLGKAMDEVTQLQAAILEEKKAREDTEEAMLRMMEDVVLKMQTEIAKEREERERMEQMLMSMLHTTCAKTLPS